MIQNRKIIILLFSILWSIFPSIYAQKTSVSVSVNPPEIMIGDQAVITLEIKTPKGRQIITPDYNYADTLIKGIEVLSKLKPDTIIAHEVMSITQKYVITSFDSTLYNIPYMYVIDGKDTIKTKNFGFKVTSPILADSVMAYLEQMNAGKTDSIDFVKLNLSDIKDIQEPAPEEVPLAEKGKHLLKWILFGVAVLLLLAIIVAIIVYLLFRKKKKGYYFKPQVILPPHIEALQHLEKIKKERLYAQGLEKEYYTELSDTLRVYIDKRFHISAMEQTSHETLNAISSYMDDNTSFENLKQVFMLSDLVKFAKYKPLPNENELSLMNAYFFVNHTKREEEPTLEENDNTEVDMPPIGFLPKTETYIKHEKGVSEQDQRSEDRNINPDDENKENRQ